jgi:hypothetical protein
VSWIKAHIKLLVTLVTSGIVILSQILSHDGKIWPDDIYDWGIVGGAIATIFGVYTLPNTNGKDKTNAQQ